ncbi:MAG: glutamyl-tRNA reductase [Actinomycetota bacterium]
MSVIVVGLNHRTVPVELLERTTVPEDRLTKVLHDLAAREHLLEVAVLSTCNRTEIYARGTHFHAAVGDVQEFLAAYSGASLADFEEHLYTFYDDAAVGHLFAVAAGLDSMIIGEHEILGQVRDAGQAAVREQTASQVLAPLFRHAVEAGRRVRDETGVSRHPVSISAAAVAVATEHLGSLDGASAVVLGLGQMGRGVVRVLADRGVEQLRVANRTEARAVEVAAETGATAVSLADLADTLVEVDVCFASTASADVLIERSTIEMVMACRDGRPLLVIDIALPRDVDPGVREINDVTLLDLDDLKDFARRSAEHRRREIGAVREIVTAEIERYRADRAAREVAPLMRSLHAMGEDVRRRELERFRTRIERLDPEARAVVEAITEGIVAKLLHEPSVRVKEAAGTPRGDYYADALATLFDLPAESD